MCGLLFVLLETDMETSYPHGGTGTDVFSDEYSKDKYNYLFSFLIPNLTRRTTCFRRMNRRRDVNRP